ncbi:MAG: hypothetical protein LBS02_19840, partial [Hungatella sp.]|nr:hypothetical protein [Hungatella sp.]
FNFKIKKQLYNIFESRHTNDVTKNADRRYLLCPRITTMIWKIPETPRTTTRTIAVTPARITAVTPARIAAAIPAGTAAVIPAETAAVIPAKTTTATDSTNNGS